jgi:uncharacterized membrane protein
LKAPPDRWHLLLIPAAAAAIIAPELIAGPSISDSIGYNIVWADQFRALFRSGETYPRILPLSWGGLGSPTFYFYPPLFFWALSLIDLLTLGSASTERLISLTSLFFLILSGLSMRRWLAPIGGPTAALLGAAAYMLAPYHLFDIFGRGALAEAAAYAFLPMILVALRSLSRGDRHALPMLAGSYAALILSHLPTALLASVFVIPAYVLFEARRTAIGAARYLLLAASGGALGLGLAAVYLLPALGLLRFVSSDALFSSYYSVGSWFFWRPKAWPRSGSMILIIPIAVAAISLSAAGAWAARKRPDRGEGLFWFGVCAACFMMISGLLPFLWSLPFLAQVQFPWRLLSIAEFAAVTALVAGRPGWKQPLVLLGAIPALGAAFLVFNLVAYSAREAAGGGAAHIAEIRSRYRDAPEYLPRGYPLPVNEQGAPDPKRILLPRATAPINGGEMAVDLTEPRRVEAPLFYFPAWRVTRSGGGEVPARPGPHGLLSWDAPAGPSKFRIQRMPAPGERPAQALSLASLLALALIAISGRIRRRTGDLSTNAR